MLFKEMYTSQSVYCNTTYNCFISSYSCIAYEFTKHNLVFKEEEEDAFIHGCSYYLHDTRDWPAFRLSNGWEIYPLTYFSYSLIFYRQLNASLENDWECCELTNKTTPFAILRLQSFFEGSQCSFAWRFSILVEPLQVGSGNVIA